MRQTTRCVASGIGAMWISIVGSASLLLTFALIVQPEHATADDASGAAPFPSSSSAELGGVRFQLGPASGRFLNTLIIKDGRRVSIPVGVRGARRIALLHTAVRLSDVAGGHVEIKYEGVDEPQVWRWTIRDWQARSTARSEDSVVSGLWWYRRDKGLVRDDANAKMYVERIEVDPSRRVESIFLAVEKLPRAEFRIYAVSVLGAQTDSCTARRSGGGS